MKKGDTAETLSKHIKSEFGAPNKCPIGGVADVLGHYDYKGVVRMSTSNSEYVRISGIIFIGRGLSVFLICPLQNYFINKYNYMPDYTPELDNSGEKYFSNLDILNKVPYLFIYEGIFFALIQFIGACLISDSGDTSKELMPFSDKNNQLLYFDEKNLTTNKENGISNSFRTLSNTSNFSYRESNNTFINRDFILIWLMIFFNWQAISYTQVFWKIFGLNYLHIDDRSLSILGGVSSIFNIFGRIFWGLISDLTSFKTALILMSMLMSFLTVTLTMSGFYGKITYSIWVCLIFFCHAGTFSIFPSITAHTFGTKNFGPIFGLLFTARAFSSIINAMISAAILNNIGNIAMCAIVSISSFVSIMLALAF
ncbi:monocarboxylate transporter, putative [Plasmodium ovale curtisi]|uniref:Monocarboxylate transporter, putative n=1 Tax=Plasmodium ovale curtisi TaxID=864141 RepID=A0A1A8VM03_PLAOA|nr:monocarboxylate transporter, putative [Plasmodium ovale curtisi]SBS81600.1 monocarboxylate transporter, putative [Plasmodium ovale curtisi]